MRAINRFLLNLTKLLAALVIVGAVFVHLSYTQTPPLYADEELLFIFYPGALLFLWQLYPRQRHPFLLYGGMILLLLAALVSLIFPGLITLMFLAFVVALNSVLGLDLMDLRLGLHFGAKVSAIIFVLSVYARLSFGFDPLLELAAWASLILVFVQVVQQYFDFPI
jgi:hypothetical protein